MRDMAARSRALTPLDAEHDVMIPGDPEKRAFVERSAKGIPIDDAKLAEFMALTPTFESALAR
jgi:LDH2 family malate/lactate/ureidoglycolate dehydrogenase